MTESAMGSNQRHGSGTVFPRLLGERLCLDFANSVESPLEEPEEFLTDFPALARWGHYVGLLDEKQAAGVEHAHTEDPDLAARLYAEAMALRTGIQSTFQAIAEGDDARDDDLAVLRQSYLRGLDHCRLTLRDGHARWTWEGDRDRSAVAFVLWKVAQSAVDLLAEGEFSRIKRCNCGWLFYDTSRNGSRRWCSMEGCGTQAKMRRFTARRRAARR